MQGDVWLTARGKTENQGGETPENSLKDYKFEDYSYFILGSGNRRFIQFFSRYVLNSDRRLDRGNGRYFDRGRILGLGIAAERSPYYVEAATVFCRRKWAHTSTLTDVIKSFFLALFYLSVSNAILSREFMTTVCGDALLYVFVLAGFVS
jgi:hypothetical protein